MIRYAVFALLACVYVTASVVLVRSQGQAYREASRRIPVAINSTPAVPAKLGAEPTNTTRAENTASVPKPSKADDSTQSASEQPTPTPMPKANDNSDPSPPPQKQVAEAKLSTISPPTKSAVRPAGNAPSSAARVELDELWSQQFATKSWNLDSLSASDEILLGDQLHQLIMKLIPRDDGPGLLRIKEAAKPLEAFRSRKEISYQYAILSSEIANAFSHPGGYIYISRKLLDMIPEDQDEALQFLIGNEIAHVDMRHAIQCLQSPSVKRIAAGTLWKLYFVIIPHAYPDELESAADEWAYRAMKRIGRSDYECLRFLRTLESYARSQGFEDGHRNLEGLLKLDGGESKANLIISPLDNHLRAHTAPKSRLDKLKEVRDRLSKDNK
jgi:Peptidase family M48